MKTKLSIILLLAAMLFTGCKTDTPAENPDDPSNPETPVNVVMQNVALTGLVKDASGNPLSGVNVTTGSLNATTGSDGTFSFTQAGTVDDRAVVRFEKSGYFTLTRSGDMEDEMYMEPMMYRKGNDSITLQTTFDASAAKTLQIGGVKIELPASCFANANGSAYSGTVRADVLNLGSGNTKAGQMMPGGDLTGIRSDKRKGLVIPLGTVSVNLTDNAGNPLKVKDNTTIPISFTAPSVTTGSSLPASVPLWTFDEARGVWVEDGAATLQGNVYTGTVSHFSFREAGDYEDQTYVTVHVTTCDVPATGADVGWDYIDWYTPSAGVYEGTTKNGGDIKLKVPAKKNIIIVTSYKDERKTISFNSGDYGNHTVLMSFYGECEGNITFNLKAVPAPNTFIVKCVPAMPLPKYGLDRRDPLEFLTTPFILTNQTGGNGKSLTIYPEGHPQRGA